MKIPQKSQTMMPLQLRSKIIGCFLLLASMYPMAAFAENAAPVSNPASFYVAVNGNDQWSGTLPAPNPEKTDGPFATLDHARLAVRQFKGLHTKDQNPITVQIRGGIYFLKKTVVFVPADSGSKEAPVIYEAYPGEKPIFSGGNLIAGWTHVEGNRWAVKLADVASGQWYFSQLYLNGERRNRPVLPKEGYYYFAGEIAPTAGRAPDRFLYRPGQIDPKWKNLSDIEITAFHYWSMDRMHLKSIDDVNRIANLTGPTLNRERSPLSPFSWYRIENVYEALSQPGEWYLDRSNGILTYLAKPGEDLSGAEVIAPRLSQVISFNGDPMKESFVEYITLRGLTVVNTAWNAPEKGFSCPQAEAWVDGAISAQAINHCNFENLTISHIGNYAIELTAGCHDDRIEGCEMTDLGAGGIKVGPNQIGKSPDEKLCCSRTVIRDNLIAHGGRVQPAGVGIWIGHANYNLIEHNEIADFYYSGISVGWNFHVLPSDSHHNVISKNLISDVGQNVLSDLGGIYTMSDQPGTIVTGNVIHHARFARYGGNGIYLDAGSSGIVVENNLVTDCEDCSIHQNFGRNNTIRNNIFAFAARGQIRVGNQEESAGVLTCERNIFYWRDSVLLFGRELTDKYRFSKNLYWQEDKPAPVWFPPRNPQPNWDKFNEDAVVADPKFIDPDRGDFHFAADSPAERIGFHPFDYESAGRLTKAVKTLDLPKVPRAFPVAPQDPKLGTNEGFSKDFEGMVQGEFPPEFCQFGLGSRDAGATSETATRGRMSFKIGNAPATSGDSGRIQLALHPHIESGTVINSFDLRLTPHAQVQINWLSGDSFHASTAAGPILTVDSDGTLSSHGKKLIKLPPNQWVHMEIACPLGGAASRHYTVSVLLPGAERATRFDSLSCDPNFNTLDWVGLATGGGGLEPFYVDNFKLIREP